MASESELAWRRRWTVDLRATAWSPVDIGNSRYLIKSLFKEDSYTFMLSDLTSVWVEDIDNSGVKARLAELNPSIEAPIAKVMTHIQAHLTTPALRAVLTLNKRPGDGSSEVELWLTSDLAGTTFSWKFCALLSTHEVLYEHLTLPLLTMVGEMSRRHSELTRRIVAKDREIADYKGQGVKASRKHLETQKFDEVAFTNEMNTSKEMETVIKSQGLPSFASDTRDLYVTLMTKYAWLTHVPDDDEDFPDDFPSETMSSVGGNEPTVQSWGNRMPPSFMMPRKTSLSPKKSPAPSPTKSPRGKHSGPDAEDMELSRREALTRKMAEKDEQAPEMSKRRKKKKVPTATLR